MSAGRIWGERRCAGSATSRRRLLEGLGCDMSRGRGGGHGGGGGRGWVHAGAALPESARRGARGGRDNWGVDTYKD